MKQSGFTRSVHHSHRGILFRAPLIVGCLLLQLTAARFTMAQESPSVVQATGCFLRIKDQAEVPARERGVLDRIEVELGQSIQENDLLAGLDDQEARIVLTLAEIDLAIATRQTQQSVKVDIAKAAALESDKLLKQAEFDLQVAQKVAQSDLPTQLAEAALALAKEEYDRAVVSKKQFDSSVPVLEMAKRLYGMQKGKLEVAQAQQERLLDGLRSQSRAAFVEQHRVAGKRLGLSTTEAVTDLEVGKLTVQQMRESVAMAREKLDRRQIHSPLTGIVVEKLRHRGEWVEAGDAVLRVIRLDTLLVEGFVPSGTLSRKDQNRPVEVTGMMQGRSLTVSGKLIFVSPEVDSLNGQIQVKAEIKNPRLLLLPGDKVEMTIQPAVVPLSN